MERLLAFGHSRLRTNLTHGALIEAAGASPAALAWRPLSFATCTCATC